jgi:hypothetical protein
MEWAAGMVGGPFVAPGPDVVVEGSNCPVFPLVEGYRITLPIPKVTGPNFSSEGTVSATLELLETGIMHDVDHVEQIGPTCWEAAFMMAFKRAAYIPPGLEIDTGNTNPADDGGLITTIGNFQLLADANGLTLEEPYVVWTADQMRGFLGSGPVWAVGVWDEPGGTPGNHAVVVAGMDTDCVTGDDYITVHNPNRPAPGGILRLNYSQVMSESNSIFRLGSMFVMHR